VSGLSIAAVVLAAMPAIGSAQAVSAPLLVTAEVVRSCRIDVPAAAQPNQLSTLPVTLTCAKSGSAAARVERPPAPAPRRVGTRGAVVVVNF
jgi:hypothetical protein